jgi:hypothetical protein
MEWTQKGEACSKVSYEPKCEDTKKDGIGTGTSLEPTGTGTGTGTIWITSTVRGSRVMGWPDGSVHSRRRCLGATGTKKA